MPAHLQTSRTLPNDPQHKAQRPQQERREEEQHTEYNQQQMQGGSLVPGHLGEGLEGVTVDQQAESSI
jgi:hypothetical protein